LPLHDDWRTRNIATEGIEPGSMLSLTRALLALRRAEPALTVGDYGPIAAEGPLLTYERRAGDSRLLVTLNLGEAEVPLPETAREGERLLSTLASEAKVLRGNEGLIVRRA
jgi:glycosidase